MSRIAGHFRTTALVVLLGLLLAAPAARASGQVDLRSPDARDAATAQPVQDLRSPDARDAAAAVQQAQDLRSPDARDPRLAPAPVPQSSAGTDWTEVGIGVGTAFLVLVGLGGIVLVSRRRHVVATG